MAWCCSRRRRRRRACRGPTRPGHPQVSACSGALLQQRLPPGSGADCGCLRSAGGEAAGLVTGCRRRDVGPVSVRRLWCMLEGAGAQGLHLALSPACTRCGHNASGVDRFRRRVAAELLSQQQLHTPHGEVMWWRSRTYLLHCSCVRLGRLAKPYRAASSQRGVQLALPLPFPGPVLQSLASLSERGLLAPPLLQALGTARCTRPRCAGAQQCVHDLKHIQTPQV